MPFLVNAIVQNGGQTCSAGSRLLIQKSVYDKFVPMIAEKFSNLTVGSHSMDRDCGALISLKQKNRVLSFIDRALDSGIKNLLRQVFSDLPEEGFMYYPLYLVQFQETMNLQKMKFLVLFYQSYL